MTVKLLANPFVLYAVIAKCQILGREAAGSNSRQLGTEASRLVGKGEGGGWLAS